MKTRFAIVLVLLFALALPLLAQSQTTPETLTPENVSQIEQVGQIDQPSRIRQMTDFVWSPDGAHLAMTTHLGVYSTDFEADGMRPGRRYGNTSLNCAAYSPDSKLLAGCNAQDGTVFIWNVTTGEQVASMLNGDYWAEAITFSPDGTLLAVKNIVDKDLTLWGVWSNGQRQPITASNAYQIQKLATFVQEWGVSDMQFNADGGLLATVSAADDILRVWDTVSEERIISRQLTEILAAAFSPDGRYLAVAEDNIGIVLLDATTFDDIRTLPVEDSDMIITDLSFSPSSALISVTTLSPQHENWVQIWDVESGALLTTLADDRTWIVQKAAFNPSGTILASLGTNDGIRLWGLGGEIATLAAPTVTPAPTLVPTPVPVLAVGGTARVQTTGSDVLNMRNNPSRQGDLLTKLSNATLVSIVDGPQENDGLVWWKVRTEDGLEGWVVEAVDGEQTLISAP